MCWGGDVLAFRFLARTPCGPPRPRPPHASSSRRASAPAHTAMAIKLSTGASTVLIRKSAFESARLVRANIDQMLGLTDQEFRVEAELVVIGPIYDASGLMSLIDGLEGAGLIQFDDFFELSGNWPDWLTLFAMS